MSQTDLPAPPDGGASDSARVLAALPGGSDNEGMTPTPLDGGTGVRRERLVPPDPVKPVGEDVGSRRVEYVVPVPGEQHQWLLVAFSTNGAAWCRYPRSRSLGDRIEPPRWYRRPPTT